MEELCISSSLSFEVFDVHFQVGSESFSAFHVDAFPMKILALFVFLEKTFGSFTCFLEVPQNVISNIVGNRLKPRMFPY